MAKYIVEVGNNRHVRTSMKDALKKAYALADWHMVEIWQVVGEKIRHIGTVMLCAPYEKGKKGKMRPVMFYFALGDYGTSVKDIYPLNKDGTFMTKVDILDYRWYNYFPYIDRVNDRLPKATVRADALRDAYYYQRRQR